MKILLFPLFLFFFPFTLQAQSNWLNDAKGVALCECIRLMNIDTDSTSVIGKDYSGSYFVQMSDLPPQLIIDVVEYVREHYKGYIATPQEIGGNMIGFSCWKFYNSKDLNESIRRIVARYRPMTVKSKGRRKK